MKMLIPFAVAAVLLISLRWMRNGGGGEVGRRVRCSDWRAWRDAMDEKEEELRQLRAMEPKINE